MSITVTDADLEFMQKFIREAGSFSRSPGSPGERKGAEMAAEIMKSFSDEVKIEEFKLAPKAAFWWIKLVVPLFFVAIATFKVAPIVSALIMIFNIFLAVGEFVLYKKIIDPFMPKSVSQNAYGVINPEGEVKQTIIFAGHIDSPFQFNFIQWWGGRIYTILVALVLAVFVVFGLLSIANGVWAALGMLFPEQIQYAMPGFFNVIWIIVICFSPLAVLFFFFTTWIETPGCGDNLSAVAVALGVGHVLKKAKEEGGFFPKHTKVITMAFGAEEAFLRGAMAYADAHKEQLKKENAILINMETLVEPDNFFLITRDLNGTVKLSDEVVEEVAQVCRKLGYGAQKIALPLGSGSTDSAALARAGIKTTCIFGMNIGRIIEGKGYFNYYHTIQDTPDKVSGTALRQVLEICLNYLKMKDEAVSA